ncbi:hypothetical protein [Photorhabdus akhurstii]|uniref:hypothetical protein n=1 Tax=Photorhabdus akhurstii TaxID=171438 RepID=UPI0015E2D76D
MLTAILEEPLRGGQLDITYWVGLRRAKQLTRNMGGHFGNPACGKSYMLSSNSTYNILE